MSARLQSVLAGAFGVAAPNLIGMVHQAVGRPDPEVGYLYASGGFWVATLVLGLIGACIVYFYYQETDT